MGNVIGGQDNEKPRLVSRGAWAVLLVLCVLVGVDTGLVFHLRSQFRAATEGVSRTEGGFGIRDSQGRERARLQFSERGGVVLELLDVKGEPRIRASVSGEDEPAMEILGDGEVSRGLWTCREGTAFFTLRNLRGQDGAFLQSGSTGGAMFGLFDPGMKGAERDPKYPRAGLSWLPGNDPLLFMRDNQGNMSVAIGRESAESLQGHSRDDVTMPRVWIGVDKESGGRVTTRDESGRESGRLGR